MDNNMDSMLDMYLFETNSLLEQLDDILLNCEKEEKFDNDSVNEIFRIMHTIKGSSAMMQFNSIATISHKTEDLFLFVRENTIDDAHISGLFDTMFKCSDFLKSEISKVENNEPLTIDIGSFEQEINDFLEKISGKKSANKSNSKQSNIKTNTQADYAYSLKVFFEENCQMENIRAFMLASSIAEVCSEIKYVPSDIQNNENAAEEIINNGFLISFTSQSDLNNAKSIVENFIYTKDYTILTNEQQQNIEKSEIKNQSNDNLKQNTDISTQHQAQKQNLINVNLTKLDTLMDLVGEIVICESMLSAASSAKNSEHNDLSKTYRQLNKLTDELQEIVMSIRMVPIAGVFQKMKRIVRDMSKGLDRPVEFIAIGEETEIDKTISDVIGDPLMHLIRNAMDHGIESADERVASGKEPIGKIVLSAENTGGEILIRIKDDGRGIDTAKILAKAAKNGLLQKAESEYTKKEIFSFILMPAFSTNEVVTEYSGRGVGLDVVKQGLEKVGGTISIDSSIGKGTTFTLKIPLTLAIVKGIGTTVGSSLFTVPINNIKQSFKIKSDGIVKDTTGREIVMIRKEYYPVIRLSDVFNLESNVSTIEDGILMLVENGDFPYCIFADKLVGENQVVLKPLPTYLNRYNLKETGISGCAILGNGDISIILDIPSLGHSLYAKKSKK